MLVDFWNAQSDDHVPVLRICSIRFNFEVFFVNLTKIGFQEPNSLHLTALRIVVATKRTQVEFIEHPERPSLSEGMTSLSTALFEHKFTCLFARPSFLVSVAGILINAQGTTMTAAPTLSCISVALCARNFTCLFTRP